MQVFNIKHIYVYQCLLKMYFKQESFKKCLLYLEQQPIAMWVELFQENSDTKEHFSTMGPIFSI
nr:unnamed protein product [Callosobruchus analis]